MKTLLLIDLSAIFWAKWHSAAGQPIDTAFHHTLGKVRRLVKDYEIVAVCCDSGRSFRHDIDPAYKANRPPKDPAAMEQIKRVVERLEADALCILTAPGYEADDIIATVVRWARTLPEPFDVTIAGCDKDLLQLIEPGVRLHNVNTDVMYGPDEVIAKFGVPPSKIRDLLALAGDSSDNVKGIDQIGGKTAAKLLNQYGDIPGILAALNTDPDTVATPAVRKNLMEQWGRLDMSLNLVTLKTDVPIDCGTILEERQMKPIADGTKWDGNEDAEFEDAPRGERVPAGPPTPASGTAVPEEFKIPALETQMIQRPPSQHGMAVTAPAQAAARVASPLQYSLEPNSPKEALAMAAHLYESRLFANFANPDAIFAVIVAGRSMGIDAMTALRGMHIIEGKPTLSAAMMVGLVLKSGKAEYFELVKSDESEAIYEAKRVGGRNPIRMGFSIKDAQRAQLLKDVAPGKQPGNWHKYPRTMLRWRAASELCRAAFPDVCTNIYTPEELQESADIEAEIMGAGRAA